MTSDATAARRTWRRLVDSEAAVWRSLFLWSTRRRPGQRADATAFRYFKQVQPLLFAFLFVSALELPVAHLLVPWEPAKVVLLVVGVWGLLWMLGYIAAMRVFPHLIDDDGLHIRHGASLDLLLPWEQVAAVRADRDRVPTNKPVQFVGDSDKRIAKVAILKQTRVAVDLAGPLRLNHPDGTEDIVTVKLYVDDARGFVATARERLAQREDPEHAAA